MKKSFMAGILVTILSGALWAHDMNAMPQPASSGEFQQMTKLVGSWTGTMTHDNEKPTPVQTIFKITAGGSAIEETLMPGTPHEMVDMYHDEGGRLAFTHYCAIGNRPHMVLRESGPTRIVFKIVPTPGIDMKKDQYMDGLTLEFPDENHLTEIWTCTGSADKKRPSTFTLTRVPTKA